MNFNTISLDDEGSHSTTGPLGRHRVATCSKRPVRPHLTPQRMTFDNYRALISNGDNWPHFEVIFGGGRTRTSAKLKEIGDIRNDLFHFKREILVQDHQTLARHRDWLLNKVKQAEARRRSENVT